MLKTIFDLVCNQIQRLIEEQIDSVIDKGGKVKVSTDKTPMLLLKLISIRLCSSSEASEAANIYTITLPHAKNPLISACYRAGTRR